MKVLIFTASYGDGHQQVGRALLDAFQRRGVEPVLCDSFRETNQFTAEVSELSYEISSKYFPWLYGVSYRMTATLPLWNPLWWMLGWLSRKAAVRAIAQTQPDAVLQLFPDHALNSLPRRPQDRPFVGVVLTDYSIHSRWFHSAVDTYYLPNAEFVEGAGRLASGQARLVVSGIPVRAEFTVQGPLERPVAEPYVVFSTGGRGVFRNLKPTLQLTREILPDLPIYVMCGRNERMFAEVQSLWGPGSGITPIGFQTNMAAWLRNAEFAVMKSGGVTVTEALVSRCPMLLHRPFSGQEADNATFVERVGAGRISKNLKEFRAALVYYSELDNRQRARDACQQAVDLAAADRMVDDVLGQISGSLRETSAGQSNL